MKAPGINITGAGAVSAAGWGVAALKESLLTKAKLPTQTFTREGSRRPTLTRPVPKPERPLPFLRNPRLRRCSPITRFCVAASLEALGDERAARVKAGQYRLGIIFVFMNGCVNYSNRFYGEVLADPALASPILFPETVFNAPASHLAAMLESTGPADTLVGDSSQFLSGMEMGIEWLLENEVDGVLVVGGEELDWLSSEAAMIFARKTITSEGAGALLLECSDSKDAPQVQRITPAFTYTADRTHKRAYQLVEQALGDAPAIRVLQQQDDHRDPESSPIPQSEPTTFHLQDILGNTLGAALALQCVFARTLLEEEAVKDVHVLHQGTNQQAIGAHFSR